MGGRGGGGDRCGEVLQVHVTVVQGTGVNIA